MLVPDNYYQDGSTLARFGFNGMERDDEIAGLGNSYHAMFWMYDSRTARRWNLDPMGAFFSNQSAYSTFNNNPIFFMDPLGLVAETNPADTYNPADYETGDEIDHEGSKFVNIGGKKWSVTKGKAVVEAHRTDEERAEYEAEQAEKKRVYDEKMAEFERRLSFVNGFYASISVTFSEFATWGLLGEITEYSYLPPAQREIATDISEISGNVQLAALPLTCVKGTVRQTARLIIREGAGTGLKVFRYADDFGIGTYKVLREAADKSGIKGLEVHHLIEKRFAEFLEVSADDIPCIVLTGDEHKEFNKVWVNWIGRKNAKDLPHTKNFSAEDLREAVEEIHKELPEVKNILLEYLDKIGK